MVAILDGDVLLFKSACAAVEDLRVGDELIRRLNVQTACELLDVNLKDWLAVTGSRSFIVALSDTDGYFRSDYYSDYKKDRGDKPLGYSAVREYLQTRYPCVSLPRLEADDVMGIMATAPRRVLRERFSDLSSFSDRVVLVTPDKDLRSIPCVLSDGVKPPKPVSEEKAGLNFMIQALAGDRVDNIPGCPGIGVTRAERMLKGLTTQRERWNMILTRYKAAGKTKDFALSQARCVWILREKDYDFDTGEVVSWTPSRYLKVHTNE